MIEIPVYLFTGFLESGKTRFIQGTMADERFNSGEKTLLLICEEGIEEYDTSVFSSNNVVCHIVEDESDLTRVNLAELYKKHRFERVVVEYNGMWMLESLFSVMPDSWVIYQAIMFADSGTILSYNANMRGLVVDKLANCELVVFNRANRDEDKMPYHKLVRGITRQANIIYEYENDEVEYDEIEDPLPFDINAPVIEIKDIDYAIWYFNLMEQMKSYHEKTVKFTGIVAKDSKLPKDSFVVGRHVMTCCADDIKYSPLICLSKDADKLNNRDWITLTAKVSFEHHPLYGGKGPVLRAISIEPGKKPEQELATFY